MACQKLNGGGNLDPNQIAALAQQAGFQGQALVNAVAIALAESGGQPRVINDCSNTQDYSVGLWQVNYYGSLMPGRSQQFGSPNALASDPASQARAAYAISGGGKSFNAWSTYTSGAYRANLATAQQAVANIGQAAPIGAGGATGTTTDLGNIQLASATTSTGSDSNCLISLPVVGGCLFRKSWLHGMEGLALVGLGAIAVGAGLFVLVEGRMVGGLGELGGFAKQAPQRLPNIINNYDFSARDSRQVRLTQNNRSATPSVPQ
jgi:hypothetical protein